MKRKEGLFQQGGYRYVVPHASEDLLMFLASNDQDGHCEMQASGLEAIHNELKSLNERLDFIEDLVEEVILRQLPKAKASAREIAEIKKSVAEMRAGESVTLEELACA